MTVNVIYDNRRTEKYEPLIEEFRKQGIEDYKIWDCVVLPNVVESISESFKMIIRWAKQEGLKEVCIAEDDLMFTSENSWKYFLDNKPEVYELFVGGSYLIDNRVVYSPPITKVLEYVGNQLIVVHESYYYKWLATDSLKHCDTIHKGADIHLCFPMVALQRAGWSSNNQAVTNYNPIIPEEYILK